MTREQWLHNAIRAMAPRFKSRCKRSISKKVRVSMSMLSKRGAKNTLGFCLSKDLSSAKRQEIFINIEVAKTTEVLRILGHELIHTMCFKDGHKRQFVRTAMDFGYGAPWTSTPAGPELRSYFRELAEKLGPFPHAKVSFVPKNKQGTRMILMKCLDCGFKCRAARGAIETSGPPFCGCGASFNDGNRLEVA